MKQLLITILFMSSPLFAGPVSGGGIASKSPLTIRASLAEINILVDALDNNEAVFHEQLDQDVIPLNISLDERSQVTIESQTADGELVNFTESAE